jgi:hypothetical protein
MGRLKMPFIECSFLIPRTNEETGELHLVETFEELRLAMMERFGGWTELGEVRGGWKDPATGKVMEDVSYRYKVAVPKQRVQELKNYLRNVTKREFGQHAIYFETLGKVEFL